MPKPILSFNIESIPNIRSDPDPFDTGPLSIGYRYQLSVEICVLDTEYEAVTLQLMGVGADGPEDYLRRYIGNMVREIITNDLKGS
jgi:hypothetical protein